MAPFLRSRAFLALSLFLFVWGAKLAVIDRFGTDLPFWDQWAKEGEMFIAPWLERGEFWKNLFVPHNEHRIAPTLATALGLVIVGGQWDARLQCLASGGLHAAILTGLFLWALRRLPLRAALAAGALLALIGAAPIAWENLLCGFQSQFYFLAAFSLLALGGLLLAPAFSARWWAGLGAGLLALVSMGSGVLCAAPIVGLAVLRLCERDARRRDAIATLAAGLVLAGVGAWLHTPTPWHEPLHAKSVGALLLYAVRCLAWPWASQPWLAAIVWLPWLVLAAQRLRALVRREPRDDAAAARDFVLAAGLWVLTQIAAVSYSRGGSGEFPANRYGDLFGLGLAFAFFALVLVTARAKRGAAFVGAWWFVAAAAVAFAARAAWQGPLATKKADHARYEQSVRDFVLTDDYAAFEKQTLPFPIADWLARILRRPALREILPASVRAPLRVKDLADHATTPAGPLTGRATRAVLAPGEWQSAPLPAGDGWWKIETAGDVGSPGITLRLVSAASGQLIDFVAPSRPAGNAWRAAYVRAPAEPARLVARVDAPDRWLAFSEPVAMSSLSHAGWRLAKNGHWLALLAAVAGLAAAGLSTAAAPRGGRRPCLP